MLGAVILLSLSIYYLFLSPIHFVSPLEEKAVGILFFVCAFGCLTFSATFHTFICHSPDIFHFCARLDYTGTAVLITGSYVPIVYYSFYCYATTIRIYIGNVFMRPLEQGCPGPAERSRSRNLKKKIRGSGKFLRNQFV